MRRHPRFRPVLDNLLALPQRLQAVLFPAAKRPRRPARPPAVEQLEDRLLLSAVHHHAPPAHPLLAQPGHGTGSSAPPPSLGSASMVVLDVNNDVVLPSNGTPINSFSTWAMNLQAQVWGASASSYSWNFSAAPDATGITGASTYDVQFSWASFTGAARTDTVSVTETSGINHVTHSYTFTVSATNSPAWSSAQTSAATWPAVVTPDQLDGQATAPVSPYASVGLTDGSVQTALSLPSYNPNVAPLGLAYNSAVADPQPTFLVHYQLSPSQGLPSNVTAQLTLTDLTGTPSTPARPSTTACLR
jgi:hypothetical protein